MNHLRLTPTEQKLYDALSDGKFHSCRELRTIAGYDEHDSPNVLKIHMYNLRLKLGIVGENVVGTWRQRAYGYMRVRNLNPSTAE